MARPPRIEFPGAIYHVRARGNARHDIVAGAKCWQRLEDDLALSVIRYGWELLSYVLMTNHLHLLLKTPVPNLSRGMQYFLSRYANWYNRRQARPGHLFQGRFKADLVEDETYYWQLSRYIHLNPRRTHPPLVSHPRDWRWSSYRGFDCYDQRAEWVAYDALLQAWCGEFGGTDAATAYCRFVESAIGESLHNPMDQAHDGWILGSDGFIDRIRDLVKDENQPRDPDVPLRRRLLAVGVGDVFSRVAAYYNVDANSFHSRTGGEPRDVAAWLARRHTEATLCELCEPFGLSHPGSISNLTRRIDQGLENSVRLCRDLAEIERRLAGA